MTQDANCLSSTLEFVAELSKPTRARELDRLDAVAQLDFAFADGQLDRSEHEERVSRAQGARTLADLTSLTDDLQPAAFRAAPASARRSTRRIAAAAIAAVLAIGGIGAYSMTRHSLESSVSAEQLDVPAPAGMLREDAIRKLFDVINARFGTLVVEGVHLYDDEAVVHVPDAASPTGHLHYSYSPGGQLHSPEAYSGQAVSADPNAPLADLGAVDVPALVTLIANSSELLGVTTNEAGFRVTIGGDDGGEVWIGVNTNGKDSHLVAELDGTIKGIHRCGWGC